MITLNEEQEKIVNLGVDFYNNSSEQVFQFTGYAGTGKSVVLAEIIRRIGVPLHRVAPMSYIGQASIVMRRKGLINAKTIHSWLLEYTKVKELNSNGDIILDLYFNKPKYKEIFRPKKLEGKDLIVIDEAGSVPLSLKKYILDTGLKVIATGDSGQLPPPTDNPAFLNSGTIYRLNKIMRQKKNSGILYLADRARKGYTIHNGFYGDCLVIYDDEVTDSMIKGSDIIICGKNNTRDLINNNYRKNILNTDNPVPNRLERVMCRKNNWRLSVDGINLANGLTGTVINSPNVGCFDGKQYTIDFMPDGSQYAFNNLPCDYKYLISNSKDRAIIKNSKYSIGEKFEFAYAITCHTSQGGQFRNGIYMEEFLSSDIQNNLNYTGITRFSNSLIYVKKKRRYY